ncbi:MAG TPA: GtrA family protein [Burkholderiales bacterium]|jgi:drug/metabolite transporter (DMT)-like permease|nr:GtrA family protein [Burkholderiales bacterium]
MKLATLYLMFALAATAANISSQAACMYVYGGRLAIPLSIAVGTGVGLLIKYALDKRYIFRFRARDAGHHARTFALYALMGVVTTAIFWDIEFSFQYLFESAPARYLGGVLGLAIGYFTKYRLDKRFVFGRAGQLPAG